jgi:exopolysaccharide biosynthesis polyprenyl glycosylphosphotransferase
MVLRPMLDALSIAIALGAAFFVRFGLGWFEVTEASAPTASFHLVASAMWMLGLLCALAINRLYDEDTLFPGAGEFSRVLRSIFEAGAVLSGFVFLTQSFYVSRSWFALVLVLSGLTLWVQRSLFRRRLMQQRRQGRRRRPAILVGREQGWEDWPFEEDNEFEVVRRIAPDEFDGFCEALDGAGDAGSLEDAAVVLRARDFTHDEFWRILLMAGERGWSVFVHSPVRSVGRDRLTLRELAGQTIVKVAPPVLTGPRAAQKRLFDVVVAGSLLLLLAPLILLIALAVLFSSGWPVLFKQERVARGGGVFRMLKFRTMRRVAQDDSAPAWTAEDDPRRTPLGRFLRRTSLDELPQLWNVLTGDMSLVGPRPEQPSFVENFEKEMTWYRFRHRMRPGLTGWAQSHGLRGNTSLDSRIQFDNWYIENWSTWLDLKILALTVVEVVRGRNAY